MNAITPQVAMAAAIAECEAESVELVQPNDPRRVIVMHALAISSSITGTSWDYATASEDISVTLPGVGPGAALIAQVPYVGAILGAIADKSERPMVMVSPAAVADGLELAGTLCHELAHVAQIRAGGLGYCLAYALSLEAKAADEAGPYGLTLACLHLLGGMTLDDAEANVLSRLPGYGLDANGTLLAKGILASWKASLAGGYVPPEVLRVQAALIKAGWSPT